tara:strand:+ start:558 stop:1124 length:567 start_codon:yes stop_codon:yes gene_type:complete
MILLRLDRGQSFKGHTAELALDTLNNKTLRLHNNYFSGSVTFYYDIKKNMTFKTIYTTLDMPKWWMNTYDRVIKLSGGKPYHKQWFTQEDDIMIDVNKGYVCAQIKSKTKGFNFQGHRKNIDDIKQLNKMLSKYRKHVKSSTDEELVKYVREHIHENPITNDINDVQTIPYYKIPLIWLKETVGKLFV